MKIFTENAIYEIASNEEEQYLHACFKTAPSSDEFRRFFNALIEVALEEKVVTFTKHRMLLDLRKMGIVSLKDQNWFLNEYTDDVARLMQFERYSATIYTLEAYMFMAIKNIVSNTDEKMVGLTNKDFTNPDKAKRWLLLQ